MSDRPFRVLLSAHVDLNVIDGSAFFVSGVASLLTSAPGVAVHVITATPIRRPVVIQEMLLNERITVTDPFRDRMLAAGLPEFRGATRMDETMAARVLGHYLDNGHYDAIVVRSTEVAHALSELRPDLGPKLCVYVTGVVADDTDVDPAVRQRLQLLLDRDATLLCQTPEMQAHLMSLLRTDASAGTVAVLSPAVPSEQEVEIPQSDGPLVLAYTGKFAPAWHTVEMVAGFKEAASAGADLRLVVAGDHFKRPPEWPTFGAEVRYLLGSHPGITWVGAVTRSEARALVARADVGIGWRHASLDTSLELSTKLLEHGVLGRPCVINPTPMHRRLFGPDYPLFASSTTEFVDLLGRMARDRALVRDAADVALDVAADYTYERVFRSVFPTLLEASGLADDGSSEFSRDIAFLCDTSERLVRREDRWVGWLTDRRDAAHILRAVGPGGGVAEVDRLGPFVRWRQAPDAGQEDSTTLDLLTSLLEATATGATTELLSGEMTVAHDIGGSVRLAAPTSAPVAEDGAREDERLSALVRQREQENAEITARYQALAGTRLGRLQRSYWRLRRRLRHGGR